MVLEDHRLRWLIVPQTKNGGALEHIVLARKLEAQLFQVDRSTYQTNLALKSLHKKSSSKRAMFEL